MSLKNEKDIEICDKYSSRDENGFVHCYECPLVVDEHDLMCKANSHYDKHEKQWIIDILEPEM